MSEGEAERMPRYELASYAYFCGELKEEKKELTHLGYK